MKFSNSILQTGFGFLLAISIFSCKKDTLTQIDIDDLNPDNPYNDNTGLDQWLQTNFLDEYNSEVLYRYDRYRHEADRNVPPPDPETVRPMMQIVLDGYIEPYRKVAGASFIKQSIPKEWVLYGGTSYDGSGVGYAGTASGGVRVNLFGLNSISTPLSASFVSSRLSTIHHEFTHIVNQQVVMPVEFALITKSTYNGNWTATHADSAKKWGYVSAYASQNPVEDFAETNEMILVSGQGAFDQYVRTTSTTTGQAALREKEASVANYFTSSLNIDYRALQKEVQFYLKDVVKDPTTLFSYWLNQNAWATITVNPGDAMYARYPLSADFIAVYNQFKATILEYNSTVKYNLDYIQFRFVNNTSLVVRAAFTAAAGGTQYFADYNFSKETNSNTGATTFTKTEQGTGGTYTNAALFTVGFTNSIQAYLTDKVFTADWLPYETPSDLFSKTGRFYEAANASNYFYGTLSIN